MDVGNKNASELKLPLAPHPVVAHVTLDVHAECTERVTMSLQLRGSFVTVQLLPLYLL